MVVSVHLADLGLSRALTFQRSRPRPDEVDGLIYAEPTTRAPLSARLLPAPTPGRVGLIAAWHDDTSLDGFLRAHPLAEQLSAGWHVRLRPTRIFGAWPELQVQPQEPEMDEAGPVAVLTLGRLRLSQTLRFLRASAAAEGAALAHPDLIASTGLARPPRLVATFSLWRSTAAMREYVEGLSPASHRDAVRAHAQRPFHHHSAFIRFRPYGAEGRWNGTEPLSETLAGAPA